MADIYVLDLKKILKQTREEFPDKSIKEVLSILNNARINHKRFKFIFKKRFYIQCPKCKENRVCLFRKDDVFRCRECWKLKYEPRRRTRKSNRGAIYARYVRPLEKLRAIEQKLFLKDLPDHRREKLEKAAEKLRLAIPGYMYLIRTEIYKILEEKDE